MNDKFVSCKWLRFEFVLSNFGRKKSSYKRVYSVGTCFFLSNYKLKVYFGETHIDHAWGSCGQATKRSFSYECGEKSYKNKT